MLLRDLVDVSAAVGATRSRKDKTRFLADLLLAAAPVERSLVAHYLSGRLRQRRTGLGWRSLQALPSPADAPSLAVGQVDAAFAAMSELGGPGSQGARATLTDDLFGAATAPEQEWLRAVAVGEVRQGALEAVVTDAIALAAGVPLVVVRRAAMLAGGATYVIDAAFDGAEALAAVGLSVGRPVLPMLASSAPDVAAAIEKAAPAGEVFGVDAKLDGIRIQVHRDGDEVLVATRSLDDITARLPEVVAIVRALPADRVVLDGEALALAHDGRPRPFQETASRTATQGEGNSGAVVTPYFFDLLHLDGTDLLDQPATERWAALERLVPEQHRVRRWVGADPDEAQAFASAALADGHEGVVVKAASAPYDAGRRGAAWIKVKPVHTLDLVVLAVERGSGRRKGWLSNIHLGARDPSQPGGFVMLGKTLERTAMHEGWVPVGKTFKGMSDEMLAWQTERLRELQISDDGWVVTVRPEQVVEIAFDGVQRSTRYPGGVALRFARVLGYRDDKSADQADTIQSLRDLLG